MVRSTSADRNGSSGRPPTRLSTRCKAPGGRASRSGGAGRGGGRGRVAGGLEPERPQQLGQLLEPLAAGGIVDPEEARAAAPNQLRKKPPPLARGAKSHLITTPRVGVRGG